jgi:molecular chaperone GrpE
MVEKKLENEEPNENLAVEELPEEVETAEEIAIDEADEKYAQLNDSYLRLMAEYDNYRKRTLRERVDLIKSAGEKILIDILPLVDDFERGIKASENATDTAAVREGMMLIYNKFIDFLAKNEIKEIKTENQPFDVDFHEAITTVPAPAEDRKGKIIDCVQKGYTLGEKIIRFPKVVVGE